MSLSYTRTRTVKVDFITLVTMHDGGWWVVPLSVTETTKMKHAEFGPFETQSAALDYAVGWVRRERLQPKLDN